MSPAPDDLRARLEALEQRVAELEKQRLRPLTPTLRRSARADGGPKRGWGLRWAEARSEDVLGKAGIALLLVGVLFLLKYTLDQGWLTAAVRVAGAGVVGAVLLGLGVRLRSARPTLGRLLTGGGIAAFYGTLWTASLLYPLLPVGLAFAGLAVVAGVALVLALYERDAALAVVGTLGGLLTPLLLYRDAGQMGALAAYTSLVLGGASVVYARQGWAGLLGAAALGGWGALFTAWVVGIEPAGAAAWDRFAFTAGVLVATGVTGVLPVVRAFRHGVPADPFFDRWPRLLRPFTLAVVAAPVVALPLLDATWRWTGALGAAVALVLAVGYGAGAARARRSPSVFAALVLAAAALATWSAGRAFGVLPFDGRTLAAVVALGAVLVTLGRRDGLADLARVGHTVALGGAVFLLGYLLFSVGMLWSPLRGLDAAALLRESLAALVGAGALGWVGFRSRRESRARTVYVTAAHLAVVLWVRLLLRPLENGPFLTSAVWGVYGIALVVVGLRLRDDLVRQIGLATVLVTALKVLLFDLAAVPGLWRVLLFMGLGGLLLVVSYLVPSLLRGTAVKGTADGAAEP